MFLINVRPTSYTLLTVYYQICSLIAVVVVFLSFVNWLKGLTQSSVSHLKRKVCLLIICFPISLETLFSDSNLLLPEYQVQIHQGMQPAVYDKLHVVCDLFLGTNKSK